MPFKSKAQRRKFAQLLVEGEITPETFEEWNRETGGKVLPERVRPKDKANSKREPVKKRAAKKSVRPAARKKVSGRARKERRS